MVGSDPTTRRQVLRSAAAGTTAAFGVGAVGSAAAESDRDHVVLLHGYMDTGDTPWWDVIAGYLDDVGYEPHEIHRLSLGEIPGTTTDSPADYGEAVARAFDRIASESGGPVDVVAHSMGGLDSRWAIEKEGVADRVDDLVTLGTPHRGTHAAILGVLTEGGRDMFPGSTLIEELNEDGLAPGVNYTAVWSYIDELIVPSRYATIPEYMFTDATGRNINSGYQEHIQLVYDRSVFDQYVGYLG